LPPASVRPRAPAQRSDDASGVRPDAASQSFSGGLGIIDPTLEPILGGFHLPLGLAAVPPQDPGGTAASVRAAPLGLAEICRRSAPQVGDLPVNPGRAPQGLDGVGSLLSRRNGGSDRGVGNPLRLPAE
jgi:hypothetical protein